MCSVFIGLVAFVIGLNQGQSSSDSLRIFDNEFSVVDNDLATTLEKNKIPRVCWDYAKFSNTLKVLENYEAQRLENIASIPDPQEYVEFQGKLVKKRYGEIRVKQVYNQEEPPADKALAELRLKMNNQWATAKSKGCDDTNRTKIEKLNPGKGPEIKVEKVEKEITDISIYDPQIDIRTQALDKKYNLSKKCKELARKAIELKDLQHYKDKMPNSLVASPMTLLVSKEIRNRSIGVIQLYNRIVKDEKKCSDFIGAEDIANLEASLKKNGAPSYTVVLIGKKVQTNTRSSANETHRSHPQ